ncbi:uncharacterized protein LOC123316378 [Coccinella septempunctata]|uniref:uncharacterized protein LOC123316378 n=1 Tax=Coccinella septempunctata TaxID=41139 RepID=UPI001D07CC33|nr:uncharacterized protein LOC123316378 [Coccinella septempunctata]
MIIAYKKLVCFLLLLNTAYCLENRGASCPQMYERTFQGYLPKGHKTAGSYFYIEGITDVENCITKCCENSTCNAALMLNDKCYTVDCDSNEKCIPILHHNENFRDNVTMILVKPEEKNENWSNILKSQEEDVNWKNSCPKLYEFTYRGYLPRGNISAGNYSYIKEKTDLRNCVLNCCDNDNCNVAILHSHKCYHVECKSSRLCVPSLYHNTTIRKSLYMVLVKPVKRNDKWKDVLRTFKDTTDENSEELLPEISSTEETTIHPTLSSPEIDRRNFSITLRLPKFHTEGGESKKKIGYTWKQEEGPTTLEFHQTNETEFEIKKLIFGSYLIKLTVEDIPKVKKDESENSSNKSEPMNTTEQF